jgi:hypothetical protein
MKSILKRLREPSTQAGMSSLAVLATLFGVPATTTEAAIQVFGAVTALAAIIIPEKGLPPTAPEQAFGQGESAE